MKYLKSLDGVRSLAVLLVMLFHFGYFPAGWIGVQIFFTLSGYLITRILLESREDSLSTYLRRFYWRRSLRIFPLLYAYLLICWAVFSFSGIPSSFGSDWPWLFTFTANFGRMRTADIGESFVHIWSLAVEEQFYLVWPLVVFFLAQQSLRRVVAGILLLSPLIRFAIFQGLVDQGHSEFYAGKAAYVLPFTQFDAFAAGAAIPLWGLDRMRQAATKFLVVLGVAASAGILVLLKAHYFDGGLAIGSLGYAMYLNSSYGYIWGYTLLNMLSMLGIICTLQGARAFSVFEYGPLVKIGKVSYGMYVYHVPLLLIGKFLLAESGIPLQGVTRLVFFVVWVLVVFWVSQASFRWLESPFLKLKDRWQEREIKVPS